MSRHENETAAAGGAAITALGSISIAVMAREGGFTFDRRYYFDPEYRWEQDAHIARWAEMTYQPHLLYNAEAHLVQLDHLPIPFRQVGGLQPNLILAAALGAELVFYGDHDPDVGAPPAADLEDLPAAAASCWEEREPIRTLLAQIDELKTRYGDEVDVLPPFFWDRSGRATIHGPIATALKLLGDGFLLMLAEDFNRAAAVLHWIHEAYTQLIRLFAGRAGLAITGVHIGECAGCMLSPQDWEKTVLPFASTLGRSLGPVRMHSCGPSDHILEAMARVENLGVLNIAGPTSIRRSRALVGPDVKIDILPEPALFATGAPGDLANWVSRSIEENAGGPMEFQFHLDAGVPHENSVAILDALVRQGYRPYNESLVARWNL